METLTGRVLRTTVREGLTACLLQCDGQERWYSGHLPPISRGHTLQITLDGQHVTSAVRIITPAEIAWAFYSMIPGKVRLSAQKIVQVLGNETHDYIVNRPEQLSGVRGIPASGVQAMRRHAEQQGRFYRALEELAALQLPPEYAGGLLRRDGAGAPRTLRENPYRLIGDGVPLKVLDLCGTQLGIHPFDPRRTPALALEALRRASQDYGHTCLPRVDLAGELRDRHALDEEEAETAIDNALQLGLIGEANRYLYLPNALQVERWLAEDVIRLSCAPPQPIEPVPAPHLSQEQQRAMRMVCNEGLSVITGGPGTGKTTTLKAILDCLENAGVHCVLAAPTGKAASRMSQATGRDATTLHKILGFDGEQFAGTLLTLGAVLLDETSMASNELLGALLRSVPDGQRVILVGDVDQLPPIDPGHPLTALIRSVPTTRLSQTHRQAEQSAILKLAAMLISGEIPSHSGVPFVNLTSTADAVQLVKSHVTPQGAPIVLTAGKAGPLGVRALNVALQAELNAHGAAYARGFRHGDPVMVTRNNHLSGLMNGMTGRVTGYDAQQVTLSCVFDGQEHQLGWEEMAQLTLAYAITIHRSQGSEWESVIVILSEDHERLLSRQLAYTAVTRAKQTLVAAGERSAWNLAALTPTPVRHSQLEAFLRQ